MPTMSDHVPTVNRLKALEILSHLSANDTMSPTTRAELADALTEDLDAASSLQAADRRARSLTEAIDDIAELWIAMDAMTPSTTKPVHACTVTQGSSTLGLRLTEHKGLASRREAPRSSPELVVRGTRQ